MNDRQQSTRLAALRALESTFQQFSCGDLRAEAAVVAQSASDGSVTELAEIARPRRLPARSPARCSLRSSRSVPAACGAAAAGPISIDIATPLLSSAIEHTLGSRHRVEIGGTQIERDNSGRMSVRIRDMLVRDADGAVVAGAPKAEVAVSTTGLLMGSLHAKRVSLVGAELAVRIETDGQITISTGAERRPLAVTPAIVKPAVAESLPRSAMSPSVASAGRDRTDRRRKFRRADGLARPLRQRRSATTKFSASSV